MNHLIVIIPVLTEILLIFFLQKPKAIYYILFLIFILYFFSIKKIISKENKSLLNVINYTILPISFVYGIIFFSTLLIHRNYVISLYLFNIIFLYFYLRIIYIYFNQKQDYQNYSQENISLYGNFLAYYFISSTVYGLESFLNTNKLILMFIITIYSFIAVYQVMWANKIDFKKSFVHILLISLILLEIAWIISFLTLSYFILGSILAIIYYILIGLFRFQLLGNLNKQVVKLYLIFGFGSILIILLTARWI